MNILVLDFETFFDKDYSLRKMSPAEYILDPRFECTGLAVKLNKLKSVWVEGDKAEDFFKRMPTKGTISVAHNALFDASIAAWRYNWVPQVMVDTLGIARALLQAFLRSLSLDKVGEYLKIGRKTDALRQVIGMRLAQIRSDPNLYARFIDYGLNDVDICAGIYEWAVESGRFPAMEIAVMDAVLRCAVTPQFVINQNTLAESLSQIQISKANLLSRIGLNDTAEDKKKLMSNEMFADLLRDIGIDPPMKTSQITGKETYAFSKQDQDFIDLLEYPDPDVQALVSARLGHKSTIEETRHERFINISNLYWPPSQVTSGGNAALMPMPLRYSGAHTHRLSGDWSLNVQNMGRGSKLRESLEAPPGHKVVAGDESQVEARFTCTLCGQTDMRDQFARGEDVYKLFAAALFRTPYEQITKIQRFIAKQCILGLGFGLGDGKFTKSIPLLAFNQMGIRMTYTAAEGKQAVNFYRNKNTYIAATWKLLNTQGIHSLSSGNHWQWGPVTFMKEEIRLPNGMSLFYHNLRQIPGGMFGTEWVFDYGGKMKRIYGGKLLENIVQALARIITMEAAVRIRIRLAHLGIRLALQVHDELVFIVPDEHVAIVKQVLAEELRRRPTWLPDLPLDCEVGSGQSYGSAK